ncbi:MAG: FHA domain-containing protein [Proteobacteria bacterium]|nr:FHA domain-containing protein [Pseudomonadota bacterium]
MSTQRKNNVDYQGTIQAAPPTEDNRVIACDPDLLSGTTVPEMPAFSLSDLESTKTEKITRPVFFRSAPPPAPKPYEGLEVSLSVDNGKRVFFHGADVSRIVLNGEPLLLGRRDMLAGHYPDIDLGQYFDQDRRISRKHLRIYRDINGLWFVEDLCSNNTTFLNDRRHPLNRSRAELKPGTKILISDSIILTFCAR